MANKVIIEMKGITKRFPNVLALDHVDFTVYEGEIHGLLGENGAGKTTLMKILYGLYKPDEGEIYIKGKKVTIRSPKDAIRLGIGMVHQHLTLVPNLTVVENIILGLREGKWIFLDYKRARKRVLEISRKYGLEVEPDAKIRDLPIGVQQRVEILKALYRNARILILDEPTTVLTPQEVDSLFNILRSMVKKGLTIIFVTHHLDEVFRITDRVTVLRKGRVITTLKTSETNARELAKFMVGEEIIPAIAKKPLKEQKPLLIIKDLLAYDDKRALQINIPSLEVFEGEILGVAGVSGNGQKELVESIIGVRKVIKGKIIFNGLDITNKHPKDILPLGITIIPEDRLSEGMFPNLSVAENLVVGLHRLEGFCNKLMLNYNRILDYAKKIIMKYKIVTPSEKALISTLSGGNIQRVVVARALERPSKLVIAFHPTRGLDIAMTEFVHEKLIELRNSGKAILLISEDLNEILRLSDRIAVMYKGRIVGVFRQRDADRYKIGLLMTGAQEASK